MTTLNELIGELAVMQERLREVGASVGTKAKVEELEAAKRFLKVGVSCLEGAIEAMGRAQKRAESMSGSPGSGKSEGSDPE